MDLNQYRVSNLSLVSIQNLIKKNGTATSLIYTLRKGEIRVFSHISACEFSNFSLNFHGNGQSMVFKNGETLKRVFICSSGETKDIIAELLKRNESEYVSDEEVKAYPRYNLLLTFRFRKDKYKKDEVNGWSLEECFRHFDDSFWDLFFRDDAKDIQDDRYYYRFFSPMNKTIKGREISYIKPNVFRYFIELYYYLRSNFEEFTANCQRDYENDTFSHIFTQFGKFIIDGKFLYGHFMPRFRYLSDLFRYICIEYFYCGGREIREDDYCEIYFFGDYQYYKKPLNGCVIIKGGKCEYKELERI